MIMNIQLYRSFMIMNTQLYRSIYDYEYTVVSSI